MLLKNTASQGVYLFAYDVSNDSPKTGDAANITGQISKDGLASAATATANPTEIGGGIYWQPLSATETNANALACRWSSSTSGVRIDPVIVFTSGVNLPTAPHSAANGLLTSGTSTGQLSVTNGRVILHTTGLDPILIESTINARQALAIIAAAACGTTTGLGTTNPSINSAGGSTLRIQGVTSGSDRTSVTLFLP